MPILAEVGYDSPSHEAMVERVGADIAPLPTIIRALVDGYRTLYGVEPSDINEGLCADFAADAVSLVPQATAVWNDELEASSDAIASHCMIVLGGRFYDAIDADGVARPSDLSFLP